MITEIKFIKDITRINLPLSEVRVWHKGESRALEKLIGVGLYNHLFVGEKKNVTLYYDSEEYDLFIEKLRKNLSNEYFEKICTEYFLLLDRIKSVEHELLEELFVELWAILAIFHEVSQSPDLVNHENIRRLMRIRETTEAEVYSLFELLKEEEEPEDYYFFQGKLYREKLNLETLRLVT